MDFALCPDDGPARIIRFVEHSGLGLLALLDKKSNVLAISKPLYDRLTDLDKQRVLTTHSSLEYVMLKGRVDIDRPTRSAA